ncbi:MAG: hypothetical protein CM1200mP3_16450 [Chloroflexota bacterium]|nr:MAG: hypothetical protein CM1200mP3_16450 [Chloroflexota bacterium]
MIDANPGGIVDGHFFLDINKVMESLEKGEVISISFPRFNKALVIDTRQNNSTGPLMMISQAVRSPRERVRALRRMRPGFPKVNMITVIPWAKSVESLVSMGIWDKILSRWKKRFILKMKAKVKRFCEICIN